MKAIDLAEFVRLAPGLRREYHASYYAMYSSVLGGVVTDPVLMTVPLDDHMVHRGDGVFEALKCVEGSLYNFEAHLRRLGESAAALQVRLPATREQLVETVCATVRAGGRREALVRVFVSRGPGGFSVNPYESPASQLYVMATRAGSPFMKEHPGGARLRTSRIPAKSSMATVKNCNYVPNMLMKKEAVDAGVDFVVGFDSRGCMTEGATENVGIVARDGRLLFPKLDGILHGTTMLRLMELGRELVGQGQLTGVEFSDIHRVDVAETREILVTGTTVNVAAVVEFDGRSVGAGIPGPVALALDEMLERDIHGNTELRTPAWPIEEGCRL